MNDLAQLDPFLIDLLLEWEERQATGMLLTPEEMCRDCPDYLDEFRFQLAQVTKLAPFLSFGDEEAPVVPGFELLKEIGRGGMGVVYKARELNLDRIVALKIPFRSNNGLILRRRFEREVKVLAKLDHPHIVQVYSAGLTGDTPYLVMEYVPCGNLAEYMKLHKFTTNQAVALIEKLARAVDAAHAAGIVHRDLKPSNILLDDKGEPLISDFGVAKLLAGEPLTDSSDDTPHDLRSVQTCLTGTGAGAGTPAYSGPEQYDPVLFGPVGRGVDVWALGVLLYELLTGDRPFVGSTSMQLRKQVCTGVVTPPTHVSRPLQRIIKRCLTKNQALRFRSAGELAEALQATKPKRSRMIATGVLALSLAALGTTLFMTKTKPVPPEWPNLPVVHKLTEKLAMGLPIDLVSSTQTPAAYHFASGPNTGRVISHEDGAFRIANATPKGCFLELLPALPPGRYRIEADLLHEKGGGPSWVGIYAGASHADFPKGKQHIMMLARYADQGIFGMDDNKLNGPELGRRTHLVSQYFADTDTDRFVASYFDDVQHPEDGIVTAGPKGWRKVALIIHHADMSAEHEGTSVGSMPVQRMERNLNRARELYLDVQANLTVNLHGGIGLYIFNATLVVRSLRVIPLDVH